MAVVEATTIYCAHGNVLVSPINSLDLRDVFYKDQFIGIVKEVETGRYEIKCKQGKDRSGPLSLTNACCVILSSHLSIPKESHREVSL